MIFLQKEPDIINIVCDDAGDKPTFIAKIRAWISLISADILKIVCPTFAGVIICSLALGLILPKSDSIVLSRMESMSGRNKEYISAKTEYDKKERELEELREDLAEKQRQVGDFDVSQNGLESITAENAALEEEIKKLDAEVASKQQKLEDLEAAASLSGRTSVVWSSGTYTVGKDLAAGTYIVNGSGSIVISNSGKAIENTKLKSDGKEYTLNAGDIVKINGSAKFIPQ